jgi:hypothetical protein
LLFALHISALSAFSLTEREQEKVIERTQVEVKYGGAYDWGENSLKKKFPNSWQIERLKEGAPGDCSGKAQVIYYWAGKKVGRCTSKDMANQKCGWKGKYMAYAKAPPASLGFMTFSADREEGHVGILVDETRGGKNRLAHASQKYNRFMLSDMEEKDSNGFWKHLDLVLVLD